MKNVAQRMGKARMMMLAAAMLLSTAALAQQEVAPDHFDSEAKAVQKAHPNSGKLSKASAQQTNTSRKRQHKAARRTSPEQQKLMASYRK